MENLNAEKAKRGLQCCNKIGGCKVCPYSCNGTPADNGECVVKMSIDALALIESQEERIEAYRQELAEVRVALAESNCDKKKLTEDNEWCAKRILEADKKVKELTDENDKLHASYTELARVQEEARAETVRKMQERIKEYFPYDSDSGLYVVLDQIANEMLEGENED